MSYYIGIDIGTSGTKTGLFKDNGELITSFTAEYPLYQPYNGYAEQDPEAWWKATVEGLRHVMKTSGIKSADIKGIGLSGQMHGLVMLDRDGKVLRRAIIWCDQRTEAECREITSRVGEKRLMDITLSFALTGFTASKILWVRNNEPYLYQKCKKILLPKDYIRYRLTGEIATDASDASGMQLLDIAKRKWSEEVLSALDIDISMLGSVYESTEITGYVTKEASALTGLPEGTPVVAGAGDNAASAVGCGVVSDGRAFTTIGTSGVVYSHTSKIISDPKGRIHTFCSAVPGEWHVMGVTQAAGLSLKWYRDNFCIPEIEKASQLGISPYKLMDNEADQVPIGSNRLLFLPYLMGERTPHLDPKARGAFIGLSAVHTRYDMLRAVMEGITFSLRDCLTIFNQLNIHVESMTICGGGAASPLWRQMIADVFGCATNTAVSSNSAVAGAALLAAVGTGAYRSVRQACEATVFYGNISHPIVENCEKYLKIYNIYTRQYSAIRDCFCALSQL